jgi:hypothetical protein
VNGASASTKKYQGLQGIAAGMGNKNYTGEQAENIFRIFPRNGIPYCRGHSLLTASGFISTSPHEINAI